MNKTAIVNRVTDKYVYLMHIQDYDKKEQTERKFWNIKPQDFKTLNPESLSVQSGDIVQYFIPESKTIIASFIILILPLLAFLLSFSLLTLLGIDSEKLKALLSLIIMFISFSFNKLLKRAGLKETLPIITKIMDRDHLKKMKESCKDCGSCTACD